MRTPGAVTRKAWPVKLLTIEMRSEASRPSVTGWSASAPFRSGIVSPPAVVAGGAVPARRKRVGTPRPASIGAPSGARWKAKPS